jgi:hypothetical protein
VARGARGRVEHAAEQRVGLGLGELGVAQHERAQRVAARLHLGRQHLDEPERLGLGAGQQPVDLGGAAADPAPGELEAELGERGADRGVAVRRLRLGRGVQAAQRVVLEQHEPVVEVGRPAVGLAPRRSLGQHEPGRSQEADAGARQRRPRVLEVLPAQFGVVVGRAAPVAHAPDHPGRERVRALRVVVQRRDQLLEARVVLGQPPALGVQRLGQPRELLERGEVALAHDGRRRHGEVDRAEQLGVQVVLGAGEVGRRRGGEPDHVRVLVAQLVDHRAHDVAPHRREVVALVEHDRADAGRLERVDALAGGLREQLRQLDLGVLAARDLALDRGGDARDLRPAALGGAALVREPLGDRLLDLDAGGRRAVGRPACDGDLPDRGARVLELAQRLVGHDGDREERLRAGHPRDVGRRAELPHRPRPLHLHGGIGRQDERAAADAAHQLDAQQRLSGARRRDDVRVAAPLGAVVLEGRHGRLLVATPRAAEREVFEKGQLRIATGRPRAHAA